MDDSIVVALLLKKYKNENKDDIIPESFNLLRTEEKIKLLNKSLTEHIKLSSLLSNN